MGGGYQDFVIKDGQLIGDFTGLYAKFEDPWHQSRSDHLHSTRRSIAVDFCHRLRNTHGDSQVSRVLEYGCGFGHITDALREQGFSSVGVDVAEEAIRKARVRHPSSVFLCRTFEDPSLFDDLDPDVIVMAEITWYVLDHLPAFLGRLRQHAKCRDRPTYLIHLLATYPSGVQQYGKDYFTDLNGILEYFDLDYVESGTVTVHSDSGEVSIGTYFVANLKFPQRPS